MLFVLPIILYGFGTQSLTDSSTMVRRSRCRNDERGKISFTLIKFVSVASSQIPPIQANAGAGAE